MDYPLLGRVMDTSLGPVNDLTSGPTTPDLELMWTPAIIPSFFEGAKRDNSRISFVGISYVYCWVGKLYEASLVFNTAKTRK